ncbi:MAG TPA: DNA primase, partial [Armatimonadota bacterium]|nr:DNA primase [Armatimonadota bacterium]
HNEKTPSFHVQPERQTWHCFGCGAGGNVFTFLMRKDGLTFPEAVERLAAQAGIPIIRDRASTEKHNLRQQLFELNQTAAAFFIKQYKAAPQAQEYARQRRLSPQIIEALGIGFAPADWSLLSNALVRRGISGELLEKVGLARERQNGGYYDYFRERLIFPIRDVEERIIAFGGRALGDVQPKYLNSPDTPLFDKGKTLYGLDQARHAIADSGVAVVVEGYMDAVMAQQAGVKNVVATLGTALGKNHLDLLRRYAPRVVLAYDGDKAGLAAAERSLSLFEEADIEGRVLILPEGQDPDEFIRANGSEAFQKAVAAALPIIEFQLRRLTARADRDTPEGRAALASAVAAVLAGIRSPIKREEYVRYLAESWCAGQMHRVREVEEAIRREIRRADVRPGPYTRQHPTPEPPAAEPYREEAAVPTRRVRAELFVLQGLLNRVVRGETVFAEVAPRDFAVAAHSRLAAALYQNQQSESAYDPSLFREDEAVQAVVSRLLLAQDELPVTAKMVEDSLWAIKESKLRERINELQDGLMQPDKVSDQEYKQMA